ncbi:unnamed protein product [Arctia plantaginis]|uniref:Uncharacterized protein n=1 Tax=Arctia plantaginis TaxID=874455 RepID=A0A8S0ZN66_ARCPL|nr:unnamed protein product [Arctia plantaginis]
MILLWILYFFAFVTHLSARSQSPEDHSRGCKKINGLCVKECEEGTYNYTPGCGPITPEATCNNPYPVPQNVKKCDYSECYCDPPTVRDRRSGKCMTREKCPLPLLA